VDTSRGKKKGNERVKGVTVKSEPKQMALQEDMEKVTCWGRVYTGGGGNRSVLKGN